MGLQMSVSLLLWRMMFTTVLLSVTILFLNVFFAIQCTIFHANPVISSNVKGNNYGEPLFLTPYLERGDIEGAQEAALVRPFYGNIISFSGFLTVKKVHNSNLFFWFCPAEAGHTTAPVVVWLQGGPGVTSLYGLFTQHGPFYVDENKQILPREYYWKKKLNILYIDNPVGAGFSFTNNPKSYAKDQKVIAENLYKAIQQFFQFFPQYLKNDFYVAGESFAGKYVPVFAHKIHESNINIIKPNKRINLTTSFRGEGLNLKKRNLDELGAKSFKKKTKKQKRRKRKKRRKGRVNGEISEKNNDTKKDQTEIKVEGTKDNVENQI